MSEGGDIPKPQDMNPGEAFSMPQEASTQSRDQNPNQSFKDVKIFREEPYTLWFGDVITFNDQDDPNAKRSVIVDVKEQKNLDYSVLHITKGDDGKDMIMVGAPSTHGVEQQFYVLDKWNVEQIKDALQHSFENDRNIVRNSELSETDKEKRLNVIKLLEDRELKRVDIRAKNNSRYVSQDDIREGKRKKV